MSFLNIHMYKYNLICYKFHCTCKCCGSACCQNIFIAYFVAEPQKEIQQIDCKQKTISSKYFIEQLHFFVVLSN